LSSGKLLWRASIRAKPLVLFDERLVVQAETSGDTRVLPIALLDTGAAGKTVLKTSLPLPPGVVASIDEGLGTAFSVRAHVEQNILIVSWSFYDARLPELHILAMQWRTK
jgi:hypothetical protein